eukprot:gene10716-11896_t
MCGSLAEEIGDLSALVNLTIVNQTFLTNHIPERIGDLHNLQYLSLERTLLQGSLPATLWQLSQLQYLEISDSSIQGSIGEGLGNLTLLTSLNLATNMFMGEVPQEINRLTYLESLSLSSNILSGNVLNDLVALSSLTMIDVSYNDMLGFVPDEIYQLTSLRILQLHSNMFMGSMYALCQITSLESLTVSMNMFQGEVPPDIGNLVFLQVLQMSSNFLTGSLPYEIGNMSQLTYMDAGDNDLSGALPSSIFHLSSLNRLVLYDTFITGSIPTEIQYLSELSYLFLERNLLTGTIPEEISRCSQLMSIVLAANQISGTLSYLLTNLTKLLVLSLPYNMVAGSIPSNLPPLSILEVQANFLSGDLSFLSNTKLIDLVSLNISSNYFTGSVYNVQLLQHLRRLDVSNNFLGGDLISVETFDKLSIVFAQSNMFSGSITTIEQTGIHWGTDLSFDINRLSGSIPSSYQNFRSINILRGNIFSCQLGREKQLSDINDPFRDQYVCGSVELNVALLLWSGLIILLGVCWLIWLWMRSGRKVESDSEGRRKGGRTIDDEIGSTVSVGGDQVEERGRRVDSRQYGLELLQMRLAMWTEILHDARMHSCCSPSNIREGTDEIYSVCFLLGGVRRFGLTITLYLILVASPLYITLSLYYGSYEQQYAWTNSAAFLSGQSAAIALLLLFLSVLFVVQVARTSILQKLKPFTSLWDSIESESLQGQALDRDVGDGVLEKSGGILDREVDCKGRNEVINPLPTNSVSVSLASTVPDAEPPVGAIDAKEFVSSQENTPEIESGNAKEGTFSNDSHPAALRNSNCFHFLSKRLWGKGALKAVFISSILTIGNIFIVCLVNGMYIYFSLQSSTERVVLLSLALTIFKLVWGRTLYMAILYLLQPLEKTKHGLCVNLMVSGVDFLLPPLWKLRSLRKRGCDSDPKGVSGGEKYFGEMTLLASADYAVRLVMMLGTLLTFGVVLPYIAVLICLSLYTNTWLTLLGLARFLDDMPSTGRDVDKTKLTERVEGVVMDEEERWSFLIKKGLALQCRHLFCALQLSIQPLAVLIILFYGFFLFDTEGDRYGPWLGLLFVCLLSGVGAILFWKNQIARAFSKCIVLWMKRDGVCCRCWEGKERDARQTEKELDDQSVDGDKTSVQLTPSFSCSQVSGT